jgi:hypothetical protein
MERIDYFRQLKAWQEAHNRLVQMVYADPPIAYSLLPTPWLSEEACSG